MRRKSSRKRPRAEPLQVAVVGRPNAGKSTLINRIIGEERLLTGPEAGITRDSIAVDWTLARPSHFRLFDTAGLRRKARVEGKLEKLAVGDALRAIRFAEVVVLVLDATQPFEKQDLQIADLVESEGRAHRHRARQVGPDRGPPGDAGEAARGGRAAAAADPRRAAGAGLGADRRGASTG